MHSTSTTNAHHIILQMPHKIKQIKRLNISMKMATVFELSPIRSSYNVTINVSWPPNREGFIFLTSLWCTVIVVVR